MSGGTGPYQALLTRGAEQDLESIHDYLCEADSLASAGRDRLSAERSHVAVKCVVSW